MTAYSPQPCLGATDHPRSAPLSGWAPRGSMPRIAAGTCASDAGSAATVCGGGWSAASAGRSRHGERPGARASVAVSLPEGMQRDRTRRAGVSFGYAVP